MRNLCGGLGKVKNSEILAAKKIDLGESRPYSQNQNPVSIWLGISVDGARDRGRLDFTPPSPVGIPLQYRTPLTN